MTTDELNVLLYQKMAAEQANYRAYLLTLPPEEILELAYAYATREDILIAMEHNDLSTRQVQALMKSDTPLEDVYHHYEKHGAGRMGDIWNMVEARANEVLRQDHKRRQQER